MEKRLEREIDEFFEMAKEAVRHPELFPDKVVIVSLTQEQKNSILTKSRIELIRAINRRNPKTVNELAEIVQRNPAAVSRDLAVLENYGILELIKVGRSRRPVIEKDMLMMPLKA